MKLKTALLFLMSALLLVPVGGTAFGTGAAANAANAEPSGCTPYGPWLGSQYDPARIRNMMSQSRDTDLAPLLSAHRGAWNNAMK